MSKICTTSWVAVFSIKLKQSGIKSLTKSQPPIVQQTRFSKRNEIISKWSPSVKTLETVSLDNFETVQNRR